MESESCEQLFNLIRSEMSGADQERFLANASALLMLASKTKAPYYHTAAHFFLGYHHYRAGALERSIQEGLLALTESEEQDIPEYFVKSCNLLGVCYNMCSDYFSGLDYFLKAYYRCEEIRDYPFLVKIVNNIGNMFFYLGDYETALPYYEKSLELNRTHHCCQPPATICRITANIIWCHLSLEHQEEAARITEANRNLLSEWSPDLLHLIILTSQTHLIRKSGTPDEIRNAVSEILRHSEQSEEYEHIFCAFDRIKDIVFELNDLDFYQEYLNHYKKITDQINDYNYRISYYTEAIRCAGMLPDPTLYVKLLEEYYELAQTNSVSRRDTFLHSLIVKIDLERLIRERELLLKRSNRYKQLSETDGLTQIYNRITAENKIRASLRTAPKDGISAFLIFDVDYFKLINDTYGHASGDFVLRQIAAAMKDSFRKRDITGRFGGDEFVIFMRNLTADPKEARTVCEQAIERLKASIRRRIPADGPAISLSIGVLFITGPKSNFDQLYQEADRALYEAKNTGRGKAVFVLLPA